jgi:solute carrier family 25 carnitine/acylcarnitine transporter 20/29
MRNIYLTTGLRGLYFGGVITFLRDSIGYGFYFWGYEGSKLILLSPKDSDRTRMWKMLSAGGIAGCITWASVYSLGLIPVDHAESRHHQNKVSNAVYSGRG